ncbi:hypothetical protein [Bradyrhizobium sp. USDA 4454]
MGFFDELRKDSPLHRAHIIDDNTFKITAVDEGMNALGAFQRVVHDTIRHEGEDGYQIVTKNRNTGHSLTGPIYDFMVLKRD